MIFRNNSILIFLLLCLVQFIQAQKIHKPHHEQAKIYGDIKAESESEWDEVFGFSSLYEKSSAITDTLNVNKTVFGWHPYWMGTAYKDYNYSLLSDIAYFSYEVNPTTGGYNDIHFWKTTNLIELAHQAGTRVSLTVTLFNNHQTFLENTTARQTMIDSLTSLLQYRNATGVNIDFERIPSSQKANFTDFVVQLSTQLRERINNAFISVAIPAVDWSGVFNAKALHQAADLFIIMGYDYYWSSSPVAGPVAPKTSGQIWGPWNATRSILDYLEAGIPGKKLCLGVPYYGYNWNVLNPVKGAATISRGDAVIYTNAKSNAANFGRKWDNHASVPYYENIENNVIKQTWYDDEVSLGFKYDLVNMLDIAGIGIWALGYDRNTNSLWNLLKDKFTACSNIKDGNLSDLGGTKGNYYPGISFRYNLPLNNHYGTQLLFRNIDLMSGDTLKIFSGDSVYFLTEKSPSNKIIQEKKPIHLEFVAGSNESAGGWDMNWFGFGRDSLLYSLSGTTINENMPQHAEVATVITNDSLMIGSHFELVPGNGIYENDQFSGEENKLFTSTSFNYEEKSTYFIRTRLIDSGGNSFFRNFLIKVEDVNDPPVFSHDTSMVVTLQANDFFHFCVADAFYDEDEGDSLTFDMFIENGEMLPGWLNYDAGNVCFSGNAPDTLNIELIVEAQDKAGERVSSTWILRNGEHTQADFIQKREINVYPNPFGEKLIIDLSESGIMDPVIVKVFDHTGRMVYTHYWADIFDDLEINTTNFKKGFYILVLKSLTEKKTYSFKIFRND